jgi:hypothetical protein
VFGDPKVRIVTLKRRSKNIVRMLWPRPDGMVRSQGPAGA